MLRLLNNPWSIFAFICNTLQIFPILFAVHCKSHKISPRAISCADFKSDNICRCSEKLVSLCQLKIVKRVSHIQSQWRCIAMPCISSARYANWRKFSLRSFSSDAYRVHEGIFKAVEQQYFCSWRWSSAWWTLIPGQCQVTSMPPICTPYTPNDALQ